MNEPTFLDAEQYLSVQQRISRGEVQVTVPRAVARQFFSHVNNRAIKATTGKPATRAKLIVWLGLLLAPALLVACFATLVRDFGWWASITIPLTGVLWTVFAGFTNENGNWQPMTAFLLLSLPPAYFIESGIGLSLLLFVASLWIHRMTYIAAQYLLIRLIVTSFAAYDMLSEHVRIQPVGTVAEA